MKFLLSIILLVTTLLGLGQTRQYIGQIDKYAITLSTFSYSDGDIRAIYKYNKFDTPITINGRLQGKALNLIEQDTAGRTTAKLVFDNYDPKTSNLSGKWISANGKKELPVTLKKTFEFDSYDSTNFEQLELLQSASTKNHYFKLILSKERNKDILVKGVNIYQKNTDVLVQNLDLNCQFIGLSSISIGDFNFDGLTDFSVFESSYAGPNTSSIYILKKTNSPTYFISDFSGVSLEFENSTKTIFEHNQCCAGRRHMTATYKVVNNKMVLINQSCIEYDDSIDDYIDVECE